MRIDLQLGKSAFIPKALPYITDYTHRWEFWYGGAGSGKSYSIAQKIIIRCLSQPIKILVCRRYGSTIRNSCFALIKEILSKWQINRYCHIRDTDFNIRFPNGSKIIMLGLDEETKLLSLNNIGCIWIEEAYEVSKDIVEQLNLRMRADIDNQQIIMSWNPISKNSWLYDFINNPPENSLILHSTFLDNPFLNKEYRQALEEMRIRNPNKARVYYFGEWGVNPDGLVFNNWEVQDFNYMELAQKGFEHRNGIDLGWVDKTAIIETLYDKTSKTIYVFNEHYKSGMQLTDIAIAIKNMTIGKSKIYVDSAEPRTIQYLKNQGINAAPCIKGADSVKSGLMFLQDNKIVVLPSCKNFINELENFSYIKSKITGEYTENTTHEFSHAIDACRYAYSDIYTDRQLKVLNKSKLGL